MEVKLSKSDFLLLMRYNNIQKDGVKITMDFWNKLDFGEMKQLLSCMINSFPRNDIDEIFPETFKR